MMADQAALVDSNGTEEPSSEKPTQPASTASNDNNDNTNNKRKTKQISLSDYFTKRRKMSTNTGTCQILSFIFNLNFIVIIIDEYLFMYKIKPFKTKENN